MRQGAWGSGRSSLDRWTLRRKERRHIRIRAVADSTGDAMRCSKQSTCSQANIAGRLDSERPRESPPWLPVGKTGGLACSHWCHVGGTLWARCALCSPCTSIVGHGVRAPIGALGLPLRDPDDIIRWSVGSRSAQRSLFLCVQRYLAFAHWPFAATNWPAISYTVQGSVMQRRAGGDSWGCCSMKKCEVTCQAV